MISADGAPDPEQWAEPARRTGDPVTVAESYEATPLMLIAFETADLVIVALNATCRALYGPDAIGRPLRDALPGLAGQELVEGVRHAFVSGEPFAGQEWRISFDPADPDKETFVNVAVVPWPITCSASRA